MKRESSQGELKSQTQVRDVLVVDADAKTGELVRQSLGEAAVNVRAAASADQAQLEMQRRAPDLVLVNLQINGNDGVALLAKWRQTYPRTEAIALSRKTSSEICLRAWRAGACDMLVGPMDAAALQGCLQRWMDRRQGGQRLLARNLRLRTVCKQLNKARHEISQQVNLLCHDLVKAYQELAEQLNETQVHGELAGALGNDVEIEPLLRRTMEWILKKLGPVNAAVFLPDSEGNHTLGAYLNFDTNADSVLVDVVAQTIVPQAAGGTRTLTVENDGQIDELFGQEGRLLRGRTWLACGAWCRTESLATVVVFRSQGEAVGPEWGRILESVGPVLAERLARAVRIYQRGLIVDDDEGTTPEKPEKPERKPEADADDAADRQGTPDDPES